MTIRFDCPKCRAHLAVPDNLALRKGQCQKCGAEVAVPQAASPAAQPAMPKNHTCTLCGGIADGPWVDAQGQTLCRRCFYNNTSLSVQKDPPEADNAPDPPVTVDYSWYLKVLAMAAGLVVVGLIAYVFWPRDNWEQDNAPRLAAIKAEAEAALVKGDYERSFAKCEEIISLVGTRKLGDTSLGAILDYATKSKEVCSRKVAETRSRQEQEAKRKAEEEHERANARRQEKPEAEPEKAKVEAVAHEDQPSARKARLTGAAWLTRRSGDSTLVRGLKVHLLEASIPKEAVVRLVEADTLLFERMAQSKQNEVATFQQRAKEGQLSVAEKFELDHLQFMQLMQRAKGDRSSSAEADIERLVESKRKRLDQINEACESMQTRIASLPDRASVGEVYNILRATHKSIMLTESTHHDVNLGMSISWAELLSAATVAKGATSVEGKYTIPNIKSGEYFVYALCASEQFEVEWLVPVAVDGNDVSLDLQNANATSIDNRFIP